jgi:flagellar biosynthesis chaperone FliJ
MKKIELLEERDQMRERTAQDAAEQDTLDEVASRRAYHAS